MRLRHAFTVGLCWLMLCVSSFASTCQIACAGSPTQQHQPSATCWNAHHDHCTHMAMSIKCKGDSVTSTSCNAPAACWKANLFASAEKAPVNFAHTEHHAVAFVGFLAVSPTTRDLFRIAVERQSQPPSTSSVTVLRI